MALAYTGILLHPRYRMRHLSTRGQDVANTIGRYAHAVTVVYSVIGMSATSLVQFRINTPEEVIILFCGYATRAAIIFKTTHSITFDHKIAAQEV